MRNPYRDVVTSLADITRRIIGQNVWLAFGLSVILILFAMKGILAPLTGALAQSAAVLVVVANSARILRFSDGALRASGAVPSVRDPDTLAARA